MKPVVKMLGLSCLGATVVTWVHAAVRLVAGVGGFSPVWGSQIYLTVLTGVIFGSISVLFCLFVFRKLSEVSLKVLLWLGLLTFCLSLVTEISAIQQFGVGLWTIDSLLLTILPMLAGPALLWFTSQDLLRDWLAQSSASASRP